MYLLDGRSLSKEILADLKSQVAALPRAPKLAVMLVGADPASQVYVNLKKRRAEEIGIATDLKTFFATTSQADLERTIQKWNDASDIDGILIQLPLPKGLKADKLIHCIEAQKDVDGFLQQPGKQSGFVPPVHRAVEKLLESTGQHLKGLHGSIIGNSSIFTEPLQRLLAREGITMKLVLGKEERERYDSRHDDVIVIAIGVAGWLAADRVKNGAIVIDVGTNRLDEGIIVGDVDARSFEGKSGWLSPSPGGVGPLTVAYLLTNTVEAAKRRNACH